MKTIINEIIYLVDKILYWLQDTKIFWKLNGNFILKLKNVYAVQFARSKARRFSGYSTSGGVEVFIDGGVEMFIDHIFLTKKLSEKVFEQQIPRYKTAKEIDEHAIHDDDLILWKYNNGYEKIIRDYSQEVLRK